MTASLSPAFAAAAAMHFFCLHMTAHGHAHAMLVPATLVPATLVPAHAHATLVPASSPPCVIRVFTACFFHRCRVAHLYIIRVNYFCKKLI